MFLLKKGHQPGVYVPLRALFLVLKKAPAGGIRASRGTFSSFFWS